MEKKYQYVAPASEIFHKEALVSYDSSVAKVLVLVPGNPGLIDFYITYLQLLQDEFKDFELLALGHAGTSTNSNSKSFEFYDITFQIQHKVKTIEQFVESRDTPVELYFFSHSMGSYLIQRIIKSLIKKRSNSNKMRIRFVGLICPTIYDIAKSDSGRFFVGLLTKLPIIGIVSYMSAILRIILPIFVIKWIISNYVISKPKLADKHSIQAWNNSVDGALKIFMSHFIVEEVLNLAREEMTHIDQSDEVNDWFFKEFSVDNNVQIWTFFAQDDYWVHESSRAHLLERYYNSHVPNIDFTVGDIHEHITHSFCVDQSVEFSRITIQNIKDKIRS